MSHKTEQNFLFVLDITPDWNVVRENFFEYKPRVCGRHTWQVAGGWIETDTNKFLLLVTMMCQSFKLMFKSSNFHLRPSSIKISDVIM